MGSLGTFVSGPMGPSVVMPTMLALGNVSRCILMRSDIESGSHEGSYTCIRHALQFW